MEVFIPEKHAKIESQNKTQYAHWSVYARYRKRWTAALRAHLRPQAAAPNKKMCVDIVSRRMRIIDWGNLVGGAKPIPDVLQDMRYIQDDSPQWVTITYRQEKAARGERGTEIRITEAP